jgi:hypothetical protein
MQARGYANAGQGLGLDELLANRGQNRHRLRGPFNAALARFSE